MRTSLTINPLFNKYLLEQAESKKISRSTLINITLLYNAKNKDKIAKSKPTTSQFNNKEWERYKNIRVMYKPTYRVNEIIKGLKSIEIENIIKQTLNYRKFNRYLNHENIIDKGYYKNKILGKNYIDNRTKTMELKKNG